MPQVAIGAAASTAGAFFTGQVVGTAALFKHFAINLALGLVSKALAPKPSVPVAEKRDNTVTSRSPIASRKIIYGRTRVGGTIVYLESTGSDNKYLHLVIALAGHETDGLEAIYFDDVKIWDEFAGYSSGWSGDTAFVSDYVDFNFYDGTQTTADADLNAASTKWTDNHILRDTTYLYMRLTFDPNKFASGIPNISAVLRGKPVFTGSITEWSNNPAWCIRDYLLDEKYGMGLDVSELNASSFIAAASLCNDPITVLPSGDQDRYTLDGVIDTSQQRKTILEDLLTSLAGSLIYSGGEFYLYGGAFRVPTITIDESDVVGPISVQTRRSRRELFNGVKGVFSSVEDNYVLTDYPAIISDTFAGDDGDPSYLDVNLPYTTDPIRAERIAKLSLLRSREQVTATIPCNLSALRFKAGDTLRITNTKLGWSSKIFEITDLTIAIQDDGILGVNLSVIETSAAIDEWSTEDEVEFIAGPPANIVSSSTVIAPSALNLTASAVLQEDGTARPAIDVSFTNNDAFVSFFKIQYQSGSGTVFTDNFNNTFYRIEDAIVDTLYSISIFAVNKAGAISDALSGTITAVGDTTAPATPTGLAATGGFNSISLAWTDNSETDLKGYKVYENTTNNPGSATEIAFVSSNRFVRAGLADEVTRYYWISAIDFSQNESDKSTGASATTSAQPQDGDDGPRTVVGYVYYALTSATAPATPSASSFTFSSATFSGLTSNWSLTPPTVTAADGIYWASQFSVVEDTFGGSQTITFSSAFQSFSFDGLVTFTSLNDELALAPGTSQITTINGGLITTGQLDADLIQVGTLDAARIGADSIDATKFAGTLESDGFDPDTGIGWQIKMDGSTIFRDADIRGKLSAASRDIKTDTDKEAPLGILDTNLYSNPDGTLNNNTDQILSSVFYAPDHGPTGFNEFRFARFEQKVVITCLAQHRASGQQTVLQVSVDGGAWTTIESSYNQNFTFSGGAVCFTSLYTTPASFDTLQFRITASVNPDRAYDRLSITVQSNNF
jgi:hypothetical protein